MLHLHCKGIAEVTNLEEYTGLKALYLESNSIEELDGLLHLVQLRCLYMSKNCLYDLAGVTRLTALTTLDVGENQIESLEALRGHPTVSTFLAPGNKIKDVQGIDALKDCPQLVTLDLSKNKLADTSCVDFLIEHLGQRLSLLKLQGNPVVSEVPSYRKMIVCGFERLNYLDEMPVFPKDRRLALAWRRGGVEEEKAERARYFEEERAERERQRQRFNDMVITARAAAEARRAAGEEPTDPLELRYQFMSEEAKAEAKMLYEEGVPEWKLEELRNQEQLPWQIKERREEQEAAAAAAAKTKAKAGVSSKLTLEELAAEEDEDDEMGGGEEFVVTAAAAAAAGAQKENVPFSNSNHEENTGGGGTTFSSAPMTTVPVAMACDESFDASEDIPVAVPVEEGEEDDDEAVEDAGAEQQQYPPQEHQGVGGSLPPPPPPPSSLPLPSFPVGGGIVPGVVVGGELLARSRAPPGAHAAARRAVMARELERHAAATDAAGAGTGGKEFAAQPGQHHKSPVVYGTRAYQGLWAQAVALGEIQEAENATAKNTEAEKNDDDDDHHHAGEQRRRSDGSEYTETATGEQKDEEEEEEFDDDDDSIDDDRDPYERYSVSTVAGQVPPQQPQHPAPSFSEEAAAPEATAAPPPPSYGGGGDDDDDDDEDDLYDLD